MHTRLRKFTKLLAAIFGALSIILLITWLTSPFYWASYHSNTWRIGIYMGRLHIVWDLPPQPRTPKGLIGGWITGSNTQRSLGFGWYFSGTPSSPLFQPEIALPLWMGVVLTGLPAVLFYLQLAALRKRDAKFQCPHCAFDLAGLPPNTKCPECGKPASPINAVVAAEHRIPSPQKEPEA